MQKYMDFLVMLKSICTKQYFCFTNYAYAIRMAIVQTISKQKQTKSFVTSDWMLISQWAEISIKQGCWSVRYAKFRA